MEYLKKKTTRPALEGSVELIEHKRENKKRRTEEDFISLLS